MDLFALKKCIPVKYFDYQRLRQAIVGQANERRFIGRLFKKGHVLRIKKGLYVWSEDLDPAGYANEVLSILIYGPSYVSLEHNETFLLASPEKALLDAIALRVKKIAANAPLSQFLLDDMWIEQEELA